MKKLTQPFTTTVFDCQAEPMRATITVPAGTRVVLVKNADGVKGDLYAVDDVPLLVKLTGNDHDPHYRYVFVPTELVGDDIGPFSLSEGEAVEMMRRAASRNFGFPKKGE